MPDNDSRNVSLFMDPMLEDKMTMDHFQTINIESIDIDEQVRDKNSKALSEGSIAELSLSMGSDIGILQPPIVFKYPDSNRKKLGRYLLVAGERRLKAAQYLGKTKIDCKVLINNDPCFIFKIQLAENEKREGLSAIEKYRNIIKAKDDFKLEVNDIIQILDVSKDQIYRLKNVDLSQFNDDSKKMFENTTDLRLLAMFSDLILKLPAQAEAFVDNYKNEGGIPSREEVKFYLDNILNNGPQSTKGSGVANTQPIVERKNLTRYSIKPKFDKCQFEIPEDQLDVTIEITLNGGERKQIKLGDIVNIKRKNIEK